MLRSAYGSCIFLSASLLFLIQPLFGKAILPWFGGSPGTWTTCMLAFQSLLLAGYAGAHLLSRSRLSVQVLGLVGVATLGLWLLPVTPPLDARPDGAAAPIPQILRLLGAHAAVPFLALDATSPLLSSWYVRASAREPYFLYAFSNAGSVVGLLAYPFLLEPRLELPAQGALWAALFALYTAALLACGLLARRARGGAPAPAPTAAPGPAPRALWLLLAAVPSVLLLAITNHITVDVAAVPFLWVAPLALYLLSFILVFGSERVYRRSIFLPAWVLASGALALALVREAHAGLALQLGSSLAVLFTGCMICHGELARLRPEGARVTEYYLWLSAGGALGGIFTGLIAPAIFVGFFELQLAILATYLLALRVAVDPGAEPLVQQRQRRDAWRRLGLGVGAVLPLLLFGAWAQLFGSGGDAEVLERRRSFHGTVRVTRLPDVTMLTHGRIGHGMEFRDPARRAEPTMYYGDTSGAGLALARHGAGRPRQVGVVGLGVGTLAAFGRPGDRLRFYELSPDVVELARSHFGFLERCQARLEVVLGDGRLSLEREPAQGFDLLMLDAFASDSVPTHLLTLEAFAIYLRHLAADGLLLINVSNRHLHVERAVAGSARHHGLAMRLLESRSDVERGFARVRWALLARDPAIVDAAVGGAVPSPLSGAPVIWSDHYSDLLSVLR